MIQWIMTGVNRVCCPWIIVANCSLRKAASTCPGRWVAVPATRNSQRGGATMVPAWLPAQILTATNIGPALQSKRQPGLNLSRSRQRCPVAAAVFPTRTWRQCRSRSRVYWKLKGRLVARDVSKRHFPTNMPEQRRFPPTRRNASA